ncbi:hypothetical protein CFC21_025510 [Triticum aestivum]|uniref:F-box domain-containing protein n=2 Tax=Triticum aestivum TaxID=4565 RepID=A0A9R1EJ92_WHEAT|nr:hypothetical protein CFC21_025510 [Triticum aestivum]
MASPSPSPPPQKKRKGTAGSRDRLSDLPDPLLDHVLSFLPNKEAGRAAGLSRRWRDVFCNVHAVSFGERPGASANDWTTFYHEADEKKSCSAALLDDVCSALLCRRRTAGHHVPLRSFRFVFDRCHHWNFVHVDQWLSYVLRHGNQELHLDLRFKIAPICLLRDKKEDEAVDSGTDNTDDEDRFAKLRRRWVYVLPRRLFTCRVIRTLCVAYCRLKLPAAVSLPLLETLSITAPHSDGGRSIQRLISGCPRLTDLTLEAVHRLKRVSVLDKRLCRFALRCCHNMKSVDIDASELRSLDYCGMVPAEPLLTLHGSPGVPSCTVDFCSVLSEDAETGEQVLPRFPSILTRLVLQGPLVNCGTVVSVGRILEQTPNLEVLSLYMEEHVVYTKNKDDTMGRDLTMSEEDEEDDAVEKEKDADDSLVAPDEESMVPDESSFSMPCLRHRVKEINMVHYVGDETQRMMARLLFGNALVLERMCVVLVKGTFALQSRLKNEIESWVVADAEKVFL